MKRTTRFRVNTSFFLSWFFACCLVSGAQGQTLEEDESRLISLLSADTAALLQIRHPHAVATYLNVLFETDDPTIQWLETSGCHDEFGITTDSELSAAKEMKDEILAILGEADRITLIFHSLRRDQIEFSLVIEGSDHEDSTLAELCSNAVENYSKFESNLGHRLFSIEDGPWFQSASPDPFSQRPNDEIVEDSDLADAIETPLPESESKYGITYKQFKNFQIVTNAEHYWVPPKKQLIKNRSFQRVWKQLSRQADVACYASPKYVDFEILGFSKSISDSWSTKDIASVGGALLFPIAKERYPTVIASFVAKFTVPRTGLAKYWNAFRKIDPIPTVPFPFYGLTCQRYDPTKRAQAIEEMNEPSRDSVIDGERKFPFRGAVQVRYLAFYEGRSGLSEALLHVQDVHDFDTATARLHQQVQNQNKFGSKPSQLYRRKSEDGENDERITFSESPEGAKAKATEWREADLDYKAHAGGADNQNHNWIDGIRTEGVSVNKKWMATGEIQAIDAFLGTDNRVRSETDYAEPIRDRIKILRSLKDLDLPFSIEVYSPRSWKISAGWWVDRWSNDNQHENVANPPSSKGQTMAMAKTAIAASVVNRVGSQLVLYTQNDSEMTVTVAVFESPELLFGDEADLKDFRLVPDFINARQ